LIGGLPRRFEKLEPKIGIKFPKRKEVKNGRESEREIRNNFPGKEGVISKTQ